ncbi:MAG: MFS transporter [Candidatus Micrarchaeota archaeon]
MAGPKEHLTRNTKLFGITSLLNDTSSEMIIPLFPLFLTEVLFAPVIIVGVIEAMREFVPDILSFFSGYYTDKSGKRKRIVLLGYGLSSVMKWFFTILTSYYQAIAVVFLERVGKGLRDAPRDSLIVLSEKKERLGIAFGFRRAMDNAGAILGPLFASVLLVLLSGSLEEQYRTIFLIAAFPALLSVFFLFFIKDVKTEKVEGKVIRHYLNNIPGFKPLLIVISLFAFGQFSAAFFILRSNELIPLIFVPVAYLSYNVAYASFSMPAGHLTDKFGGKKAIILGQTIFLIVLFGFAFTTDLLQVFVLFILLGGFMALYKVAPQVLLAKQVETKYYATAIGAYKASLGLVAIPANLIAGALWDVNIFGLHANFVFSIVMTVIGILALTILIKEKDGVGNREVS